jgi:NAD(P)H-nitrite reductase large subunit
MKNYKYLIIGGGMTADSAVSGIREIDSKGSIALISSESDPPYDRPPLTKGLWKDKPLESVWRQTTKQQVDLCLGRTVTAIDVQKKTVTDDKNEDYQLTRTINLRNFWWRLAACRGALILAVMTSSIFGRWPIIGVSGN